MFYIFDIVAELLSLATLRLLWCAATVRLFCASQQVVVQGLQKDAPLGRREIKWCVIFSLSKIGELWLLGF